MEDADVSFVAGLPLQRRLALPVIVPASDGEIPVQSGAGGFIGDASEPEIFRQNYHWAVLKWAEVDRRATNGAMLIRLPPYPVIDASIRCLHG
eukprot:910646-Pyramimonas_sp.AAC.1